MKIALAPGVFLWREKFPPHEQQALLDDVLERLNDAPLYRPVMPGSGTPFSAEQSNFGPQGWVSDKSGYRYQTTHPVTANPWPALPPMLQALWDEIAQTGGPQCCLVNRYRDGAKMGLHQDRDEGDTSAPVIGVSLGDEALFRIGGPVKGGRTTSIALSSGDVIAFGGPARLAYHGIDRIKTGSSRLVPGGGRLSLTLRRVGP